MPELVGVAGMAEIFRKSLAPHIEALMKKATFEMRLDAPIVKVDPSTRTIEGVAQAEVVDASNEIISYQASKEAFSQLLASAGKIPVREMHGPIAAGKSVGVSYDDRAKTVTLKARISRGAQSTWEKILDGTLSMLSISGTRLRSEMRADGVRWTSQFKLNEVSVVDLGSNPACKFEIVKSVNGVLTATDIVALDVEGDYQALADALDAVSLQLAAKCRPLPAEVSKALSLAGSPIICNQLAPDDFSQRGAQIASDLRTCAKALRGASELSDLGKARSACAFVLSTLVSRRDLGKARSKGNHSSITLEGLQAQLATTLTKLRGMRGSEEAIEKMEVGAMALHTVAEAAGGLSKSLFTAQELTEMEEKLRVALSDWHSKNLPQNVPEYRRLSDSYFIVSQRLKAAR